MKRNYDLESGPGFGRFDDPVGNGNRIEPQICIKTTKLIICAMYACIKYGYKVYCAIWRCIRNEVKARNISGTD